MSTAWEVHMDPALVQGEDRGHRSSAPRPRACEGRVSPAGLRSSGDQGYSGLEGHRTSPGTCDGRPIARLPQCNENAQCQNVNKGDFPRGPMAKTSHSQCRGPGSIPGQGTSAHMPQQDLAQQPLININIFLMWTEDKIPKEGRGCYTRAEGLRPGARHRQCV